MVNRIILLCLLLLCLCVNLVVYGRSGGGSRGSKSGSRSSSSRSSLGRRSRTDADTSSSSSSKHIYQWTSSGISELKSSKSERRLAKYQSQLKNKRKNIPKSSGLSEKHSYPSSYGLSGSAKPALGSAVNSYVPHFKTGSNTALQYVQEYKHSNSRYGDLLIGLTLYNMGRSHRHYHNHFYYDDYYKQRYESFYSDSSKPDSKLSEPAKCTLRIKENEKLEILRIPCEIVSTFTQDSKTVAQDNLVNTTVCVVNSTIVLDTAPFNTSSAVSSINADNISTETTATPSSVPTNMSSVNSTESPIIDGTYNVTVMNLTKCASTLKEKDPLEVKGPPENASNMECSVEIQTSTVLLRNNVDCSVLIKYAEMPEPQKDNGILPARDELKSWLTNPPWWLSMFIVV